VNPIFHLLESFNERQEPIRVAFLGSATFSVSFGRPVVARDAPFEGFFQWHSEGDGVSTYSSYFGWGKVLVATFEFQEDYPPPARAWIAFVRLAALIQRYLDNPSDFPQLFRGDAPVRQLKPSGPRPRSLSAEAPLDEA
jgi:hypothetical protein